VGVRVRLPHPERYVKVQGQEIACHCTVPFPTAAQFAKESQRLKRCYVLHLLLSLMFFIRSFRFFPFLVAVVCRSHTGDLYGGAHYIQSCSSTMTLQGRAIRQASVRFGDGTTLPFTPCKTGYQPYGNGVPMLACPRHDAMRKERVRKEGGRFRNGEAVFHRDNSSKKRRKPGSGTATGTSASSPSSPPEDRQKK